ncbi:hypothetical protein ES708_33573 [subsurface metagenome]
MYYLRVYFGYAVHVHRGDCMIDVKLPRPQGGYSGRFIRNPDVDKLIYKRYLIFHTVDGCRVPVMRIPYIGHVRTNNMLLKHKWSGANQVIPIIGSGFYHFRSIYSNDPSVDKSPPFNGGNGYEFVFGGFKNHCAVEGVYGV